MRRKERALIQNCGAAVINDRVMYLWQRYSFGLPGVM